MSNSIIELINQCCYPINLRDYIANILLDISLTSPSAAFYKTTQENDYIIAFIYNISTSFKEKKYEIPIFIIIPKNFPFQPPEVVIDKAPDTGINPKNLNIDPNTNRIFTNIIKIWNQNSQLGELINEVTISFNTHFPVYKLNRVNNITSNVNSAIDTRAITIYSDIGIPTNSNYNGLNRSGTSNIFNSGDQSLQLSNIYSKEGDPNIYNFNIGQSKVNSIGLSKNNFHKTNTLSNNYSKNLNDLLDKTFNTSCNNSNITSKDNTMHDELAKKILKEEIRVLVEPKIKDELKRLKQQKSKLKNYHSEFSSQIDRYQKLLAKREEVVISLQQIQTNIGKELQDTLISLTRSQDHMIMQDNVLSFININEKDKAIIHILSIEATIEDIITAIKKAFEKGIINFNDNTKFIRNITRELFKIKYYRERLLSN
jgi:hypothetical protein